MLSTGGQSGPSAGEMRRRAHKRGADKHLEGAPGHSAGCSSATSAGSARRRDRGGGELSRWTQSRCVVWKILAVTTYGSMFEAGRRSSK